MYNGIGLQTPRGSGTSGYVQRNKSYLRPQRTDIKPFRENEAAAAAPPKPKKADPELIYHNQKREIEVKLIDLHDTLIDAGEDEEIAQKKVDKEREKMYKELDDRRADAEAHGGELQADQMASTHEYLQMQKRQADRAAKAFGINTRNHEEGAAFDKDRQHQEKLQRMMDAQARDAERWAAPGGGSGDNGPGRKHQRDNRPLAKGGESWRDFATRRKEKGWAAEEREETGGSARRKEAKRSRINDDKNNNTITEG
ncbi:Serine/arginine repetitive matrix protein 2 [Perkinsus chesapeaki]|uniref:Serine/arginine repetitive matrix protein 2 n=1 Tax=Perkinsus chesapeaki TaxID=330153 RepID=A0A7J6N2M7_PERCH|nr:Serine/arginine repetitive matrix protein 2 [Perkinsus chesapeaki]